MDNIISLFSIQNQPSAHRHHVLIEAGCPYYLSLNFPAEHANETTTICHIRESAGSQWVGRSPQGLKGQTLSPSAQWRPSYLWSWSWCRCPCRHLFQLVPSALPTALSNHSSQPYLRLHRCQATLLLLSLRPPLRVGQPVSWMRFFSCRRKWTWPWSNYSQTGPPWISNAESWDWRLNLWHAWMMPRPPKPSKRPRYTARMQPVPFRKPMGQCAGTRMQSKGKWGMGSSNLHRSLQDSCTSLIGLSPRGHYFTCYKSLLVTYP